MIFFQKLNRAVFCRSFCSTSTQAQVVVSKSTCPYENLAYEDFIYENKTFSDADKLLFIWRNNNAVVIGRHQNPWKEVNLNKLKSKGINLCRRMSGGGTVYHDLGNVNFTFFTNKINYNRTNNLDFIIQTLQKDFAINLKRNEKDDIVFRNQYKVSGTAAKLGLKTCYHHCTLLCNTNLENLSGLLTNPFGDTIKTNATESTRSQTRNLFDKKEFDFNQIVDSFSQRFIETNSTKGASMLYKTIDPGKMETVISKKRETLESWEWIFAKSPKFSIQKELCFDGKLIEVILSINKGKLETWDASDCSYKPLTNILNALQGCQLRMDNILSILSVFNDGEHFDVGSEIANWFGAMNLIY